MKQKIVLLFAILIMVNIHAQDRFTTFNSGTAFTAITVDGENERVWAGTDQSGIFKLNIDTEPLASSFTIFSGTTNFSNLKVKSMAADKLGNVWIGHHGVNFVGSQGGLDKINSSLTVQHYWPESNWSSYLLAYHRNDGVGNLKTNAITVDKNNTVWAAHHYRDLISSPNYFMMPGTISYKSSGQDKFITKGGWKNASGVIATQPPELPYPAFTTNPPASQSAQARVLDAISSDDTYVWVGMRGYKVVDGDNDDYNNPYIPHRVLRYKLDGTPDLLGTALNGGLSFEDMGFSPGGVIYAICANNNDGTWVSTSAPGKGFSVYKDGTWTQIDRNTVDADGGAFTNLLPESTRFNKNAMWHDEMGRVFMGTDKGLIVYNGVGDPIKVNSYKIYTNYEFGGADNALNVVDASMTSINIIAGSADPNNRHRSWIATTDGVMEFLLYIDEVEFYHVYDHSEYDASKEDTTSNIILLSTLKSETLRSTQTDDGLVPRVAIDGSGATVLRFKTDDAKEFYEDPTRYKLEVTSENDSDVGGEERFGKFEIKELSSYGLTFDEISQLDYVEFIYTHPKYIHADDYVTDQIFGKLEFKIMDVSDDTNPIEIFKHPIKISLPPILIGHGVWSDISSVKSIEDYFKTKGFPDYTLVRVWRPATDPQIAENSFMEDSWVIPDYIMTLKYQALINNFSVGKVNVFVHSRGGLYTRGYIEEIDSNITYRDNINSLTTINTPHFGSQGGNFALDKRTIRWGETNLNMFFNSLINLGTLVAEDHEIPVSFLGQKIAGISEAEKVKVEGAKHLLVEIDNISGITPAEDPGFIVAVNRYSNLEKLKKVPLHVISSEFDAREINVAYGTVPPNLTGIQLPLQHIGNFLTYFLLKAAVLIGPTDNVNSLTENLYNGPNDFIVPLASMQASLGGTNYNTHYDTTDNFAHIDLSPFSTGILETEVVHNRLLELIKSKVYDESSNGNFTQNSITNEPQTYNFLSTLPPAPTTARDVTPITSKILINRDPAIFDNVIEGATLTYNIYVEDVDKIMVTYESGDSSNVFTAEVRENLNFENSFSYTILPEYAGKLKITAYGFKNGFVGFVSSVVTLDLEIPTGVTLQGIHFKYEDPTILNQDNYPYKVLGTYSDGIDRELNNADITFTIEDTAITSQVDDSTIKGEAVGTSILTAAISGFEDVILITVQENPTLQQTILTSFYGIPNTDNTAIAINWETLREFENATFVLETSYGMPDNFTEINQQAGNGTTETPAQFNFEDTTFGANTLIYYRIKMIDTSGNFTYSSIIEINLSTAGVDESDLLNNKLELYPNPTNTNEVTLKLNSNLIDSNAKLEMYSLQGKRLSVQTLNVVEGTNSFNLKIGNGIVSGIYLVKVTTAEYIKTVKLIIE